jgi:hypothetical protein
LKDGKERVTQSEAARRLGMSAQALGVWAAKSGAPVVPWKKKRHCLWPDFPVWIREQLMKARVQPTAPAGIAESEARQEAAKAQLLELKLAEQQGRLMTTDHYRRVVGEAFDRVTAQMKAMKKKLAPEILAAKTPQEAEVIIDDHVMAVLAELYEGNDVPAEEPDDLEDAA